MRSHSVHFGPRLIARPTGTLRAAALVRPTVSIERAVAVAGEPGAILSRALEQHAILVKTLAYFGVEIVDGGQAQDDALGVCAADAAVAFEDGALIMRPTAMARRAEADRMEAAFARIDVPIAGHIAPPGLLDGNDVLLAGRTAFVGVGPRGNATGRGGFTEVARAHGYDVVEVPLRGDAPLRALASAVADDTVVLAADALDAATFTGFKTIVLERGETLAAGVLCLSDRHVIAELRYRTSQAALRRAGITVEAIDLYEFTKIGVTPAQLVLALKRD
jgi:N-dimethylarginine dimethylaminohydrolase